MPTHDKCAICRQPFGESGDTAMSEFAVYGGLPPDTCGHCFEANDYSIKSRNELQIKSMLRRAEKGDLAAPPTE